MSFAIILFVFIVFVDFYSFKGIRLLLRDTSSDIILYGTYTLFWLVTAFSVGLIIYILRLQSIERTAEVYSRIFLLGGIFMLFYIPKVFFIVFHFSEDIIYGFHWIINKLIYRPKPDALSDGPAISRYKFLTQIGLIIAAIPFVSILYGMTKGRFNFRVIRHNLSFTDLPSGLSGLKIIQISDIHLGSLYGHQEKIKAAVELINKEEADILVFTGDMVNNFAEELDGWMPLLKGMQAKKGKYAILGNHDYGDYFDWKNKEEKQANLDKLVALEKEAGFDVLLNESREIKHKDSQFELLGIENWGLPPFPQYGNLEKTMKDTSSSSFKILMSHDPSHWDAEVLHKTPIQLTLSGHTHGMQFGIEAGPVKWSPAKYKYPRWAGLYEEGKQKLYVNRGLGYIGFPGRVGMPPEITILTLEKA